MAAQSAPAIDSHDPRVAVRAFEIMNREYMGVTMHLDDFLAITARATKELNDEAQRAAHLMAQMAQHA